MTSRIEKVIRLDIDTELYFNEINNDFSEWWFDYSDLKESKKIFKYLNKHYSDAVQLLKDGECDYISVYPDCY